ncbi:MAG: COX15/CtaA family protein [Methylococcaceae bacterium]|nr:COX15/CtaA family protein [Methylococcaceae bacterium]MCI0668562.1 COX15/CtaA family protein [Methylococcaceae bacterium]MCI0733049.1 COX15/CtaA family protein [Methylococcaceae bacterium]
MNPAPPVQKFKVLGSLTILAVYVLILVGGIVRASGAGLGCPDWPTCFGRWMPPTSVSELPQDYQKTYADSGYADTRFNVTKTWTEYLNRLTGAGIGFLIFLTLVFSWSFRKSDPRVFYLSLGTFFLVGFQGWLGAVVVASQLQPGMITVHMIVALVIVALLIYAITRSQIRVFKQGPPVDLHPRFRAVLLTAMAMTLLQVLMGTQVRESVDTIAAAYQLENRHLWRSHFPFIFYIHRSFAAIILFTNAWLIWQLLRKVTARSYLFRCAMALGLFIVIGILTGVTMDRLGIPAAAQPVHLLMAALAFGMQFFIYISLSYSSLGQAAAVSRVL